jgi:hypothetical protein
MMYRLRVEKKEKRPQNMLVELHGKDGSAYRRFGVSVSSKNVNRAIFM